MPPVECPVCKIQLSSQQVYVTHVEGKAHKKKLIQLEKDKSKRKELEKVENQEIVTIPKITPVILAKETNDIVDAIMPSNNITISTNNIAEQLTCPSTQSIIIQPPSGAKKKKKNKVSLPNFETFILQSKLRKCPIFF